MTASVILVMGVSGSGKSTIGMALAEALGAVFLDADAYHSQANIARMHAGHPLDDAAREPWLHRVHAAVVEERRAGRQVVFACSALKAAYREVLFHGIDDAVVVHLDVDRTTLDHRLRARHGHFMPAGLLDSQLADLEAPDDAIVVDASREVPEVVAEIVDRLGDLPSASGRRP